MARVLLRNVEKKYSGGIKAVSDFNLEIEDKEFIILVGPSGCGKTSTLRMIAGLEDASAGEIYIDNQLVNNIEPKDRDIAMVFQNYALYPHMTVFKNMAFGLKLRKTPKNIINQRVLETAQILEIGHLLNRKPKELSGGQRQRVALGRAIVRQPKVFLMDEPLSNLDAKLRVQMRAEISKLYQKLKTTIIYVTHDQTEAMTMGTRIVVMKDGHIQQVDTPQMVYEKPQNMFVAGFIGSPQMNMINVAIKRHLKDIFLIFEENIIKMSEEKARMLDGINYSANEAVMGIRPEDIHVVEEDNQILQGSISKVKIEVVEMLGAETYLHILLGDIKLIARVNSKTQAKAGDTINIAFDLDKIHLFDSKTEKSILN